MRILLGLVLFSAAAHGQLVDAVRNMAAASEFGRADSLISQYAQTRGVNAEVILAESWLARGLLDSGSLDEAEKHADQTEKWALADLSHFGARNAADQDALALSASIEVRAQVMVRRGARTDAVAYLKTELEKWKATPAIATRVQKNLNLLTLEGKVAPALDITHWTGETKPVSLTALRGHPVLLFFWAHWCSDCKSMVPAMQKIYSTYTPKGLRLVLPTMQYGFAAQGEEATPEQENAWIDAIRKQYYASIGNVPMPVSQATMDRYGVSTTPTIVLVDKAGIVRMYHPGLMTYSELAEKIGKLL